MSRIKEIQSEISIQGSAEVPWDIEKVDGPKFEGLVRAISSRIKSVESQDNRLQVELKGDIFWDSWANPRISNTNRDHARLQLVARAAVYVAAMNHVGDEQDLGLFVNLRDLEARASMITTPHPWYADENCKIELMQYYIMK